MKDLDHSVDFWLRLSEQNDYYKTAVSVAHFSFNSKHAAVFNYYPQDCRFALENWLLHTGLYDVTDIVNVSNITINYIDCSDLSSS